MKVATHDGGFHADDVFAVAALRLADPELEVVRSRDPEVLETCDVRVDVGLRSDPAGGDFDHHQRGGAGVRDNGIPYASFGLVWAHVGPRLCGGDERAAAHVDQRLVQGVDAIDTGFTLSRPVVEGVRPMDVSDVVDGFNPPWDEDPSPADRDARFARAVDLAAGVLERQIEAALARARAHELVRDAIARAGDPRLVELPRNMPWYEPVVTGAPEALYVTYPKSDGWALRAVPRELGAFGNRRDLPAAWAGLSGGELAAVTGVADATFCHSARFYAAAATRDGILALARAALDGPA
jgi:uncharacterized UPF0160 family protein